MDGVLADFFTEYAKLAGITSGNYRDIPRAKTDPTLNKMIGTDFFARLPECRNAQKVVELALAFAKSHGAKGYCICSSPLRNDHKNSEIQKKIWIKNHLKPQPIEIVIAADKSKYAVQQDGTPNILIDDRGTNIQGWEAAGGIGIKYQADEDSLSVIVKGLSRAKKILGGETPNPQDQDQGDEAPAPKKSPYYDLTGIAPEQNNKPTSAASLNKESISGGTTGSGAVSVGAVAGKRKGKVLRRASSIVV